MGPNFILKLFRQVFPKPPDTCLVVSPVTGQEVSFYAESQVEAYRTIQFGGERELVELILSEVKDDDVVWDIGSNIGLVSILVAVNFPSTKVYAFEPDPQIARRVNENAELNRISNVSVMECALAEKPSKSILYTDGVHGFSPSLKPHEYADSPQQTCDIVVESIDNLVQVGRIPIANVVKIDVEGAELLVLIGMKRTLTLRNAPRILIIEFHSKFIGEMGGSIDDCKQILVESGYCFQKSMSRHNKASDQHESHEIWSKKQ